jgi:hypothetical protein
MAQISIRNNLLKRYNNKFRRNEKGVCATTSFKSLQCKLAVQQACDKLVESRVTHFSRDTVSFILMKTHY